MKNLFVTVTLMVVLITCSSWGFYAHMRINRLAVFTLPAGINSFYKNNITYISDHAVDPDKRRYADTAEAARHFLDVELYEKHIDSIPYKWEDALKRYGWTKLNKNGILPWQIQKSYYKLVNAFKDKDSLRILIYSAYLGHYIADAHVPLHTTQNHNGQLTNQLGIHAFWESRLPELFAKQYNYVVGPARYIENPLAEAWKIVKNTHTMVDTVLNFEARLSKEFPARKKYSYSKRNNQLLRQYSFAYSKAYHDRMENMVERQMRSAILSIGSYWYTAWIDAGQPILKY
ncbi:zinc dependent phospholipase C family protein [Pedobacter sp. ASV1-7]|uniref:zinc dependent phospholipase C family protein n=1 Tax=Pedobacter sp. ASV1-7 TaxID=3145237 RepID=UPI0032E8F16F